MPGRQALTTGALPSPRLLAAARVLVGMTQRELAAAAGIDRSLVGRYEAGVTVLRSDNLAAILAVLRDRGIQFLGQDEEIAMGLALRRSEASRSKE